MKKTYRRWILIMLAVFFPVSEIWKQILLYRHNGYYDYWYFPFQLCSMPLYLLPVYVMLKEGRLKEIIGTFLMDYGLVSGIAVFLDTSGMFYPIKALTFHSFLWHILMILMSLIIMMERKESHFREATLLFLALALIATIFNCTLPARGLINMFYISPYCDMEQIVFRDIAAFTGQHAIRIIYLAAIIAASWLIDGISRIIRLS